MNILSFEAFDGLRLTLRLFFYFMMKLFLQNCPVSFRAVFVNQ